MIDDIVFTYEKLRKNFGRPLVNLREETKAVGGVPHEDTRKGLYVAKNPKNITLTNIPDFSEHGVPTAVSILRIDQHGPSGHNEQGHASR